MRVPILQRWGSCAALASVVLVACRDAGVAPVVPSTPARSFSMSGPPPVLATTILVGGGGDQRGSAVAVSGSDLYAAGYSSAGGGLLFRFTTPPGAPVWSAELSITAFLGLAVGIGVQYPVGNAVPPTCGASDGAGDTESKTLLARYDAGGSLLECRSENYFPYRGNEGYNTAVSVTEAGTPFVYAGGGGEQTGFAASAPFFLAKYDASGTFVAAATEPGISLGSFGGCCPGVSNVMGLAELGGDLYLAGHSRLPGFGEDNVMRPVLMRYTSSLARVWKARPSDNPGGIFWGTAAHGGALYAVGQSGFGGGANFLIEKYDPAGNRMWTAAWGGAAEDALTGVVGVDGRLFAVGHTRSDGAGGADAVLIEIDPTTGGALTTIHLGGALDDLANGVATDGSDLYVIGESRSSATADGNAVGQSDLALWHLTLPEAVLEVAIDIKPGSDPNSINLGSGGTVPVAILSSSSFDATTVDPTTVILAEAGARLRGNGSPMATAEDVNGDGLADLVVHVTTQTLQLTETDTEAVLTGRTYGGTPIRGSDAVRIVS